MALDPTFANACNTQAILLPKIFGIEITDIKTSPVTNASYTSTISQVWTKTQAAGLSYCHVDVQYTHPGQDDSVTVNVYLPQKSD